MEGEKYTLAKGTIQWVADECAGYLCACGEELPLIVSIYKDAPAICPTCGTAYVLEQINRVYQTTKKAMIDLEELEGRIKEYLLTMPDNEYGDWYDSFSGSLQDLATAELHAFLKWLKENDGADSIQRQNNKQSQS